jgi:hypothetical protein
VAGAVVDLLVKDGTSVKTTTGKRRREDNPTSLWVEKSWSKMAANFSCCGNHHSTKRAAAMVRLNDLDKGGKMTHEMEQG